jgi:hypothetical protein
MSTLQAAFKLPPAGGGEFDLPADPAQRPFVAVGAEILEHPGGLGVLFAIDRPLAREGAPRVLDDLRDFAVCVQAGFVPPADVLRRLAAGFADYLERGTPGALEASLGLKPRGAGKRHPLAAWIKAQARDRALELMRGLHLAGATIDDAAELVAAKARAEKLRGLARHTLLDAYQKGWAPTRRALREFDRAHRWDADQAEGLLRLIPDGDEGVRQAKQRTRARVRRAGG